MFLLSLGERRGEFFGEKDTLVALLESGLDTSRGRESRSPGLAGDEDVSDQENLERSCLRPCGGGVISLTELFRECKRFMLAKCYKRQKFG